MSQRRLARRPGDKFSWSRADSGDDWGSHAMRRLQTDRVGARQGPFPGYGSGLSANVHTKGGGTIEPAIVQNVASAPSDGMVRFRRDLVLGPKLPSTGTGVLAKKVAASNGVSP